MGRDSVTSISKSSRKGPSVTDEFFPEGVGSVAWSKVAFAASEAFADAVRRRLRTRFEDLREGLWKRVITSRVLCCLFISSFPMKLCEEFYYDANEEVEENTILNILACGSG